MADRSKLEKFVGMLGSDHDGEMLNALRFIKKMAADEKKTITELLLSGGERIVYREKIVYRDAPQQENAYAEPKRYRDYSSRFYERDDPPKSKDYRAESRDLLDALKKVGEEGADDLDWQDLDFARTVPYEYTWDYELSGRQVRYARSIITKWKRRSAEPPI